MPFGKLPSQHLTRSDIEARKAIARMKAQLAEAEKKVDGSMDMTKQMIVMGVAASAAGALLLGAMVFIGGLAQPTQSFSAQKRDQEYCDTVFRNHGDLRNQCVLNFKATRQHAGWWW